MAVSTVTRNRRSFTSERGKLISTIVRLIAGGLTSQEIAERLSVSVRTVATTRGNLTRGFYAPFALVNNGVIKGNCRF